MHKFFEDGLSADELKIASLVFCMIGVVASCVISYFIIGEIHSSLIAIADALIYSVAGVHIVKGVAGIITEGRKIENNKGNEETNKDENTRV